MPEMPLHIAPVLHKRDMAIFLRLPWTIQGQDPNWVPPLLSQQRAFLNPQKSSFFKHGQAAFFLAFRGRHPVGRISAHVNRLYETHYDDHTGFFGFFECTKDHAAAHGLLDAAGQWLRERCKTQLVGPLSFSIYDEVGCLVEGFEHMPAIMQVHNPPYYAELITSCGFEKAVDWYALRITDRNVDANAMQQALDSILIKQQVRMVTMKPREALKNRREEIRRLFNQTWEGNWMHIPFTREQFDEVIEKLMPLLRTDFMRFMLDDQDRIQAFIVTVPDINPAIRKLNGRLSPWGLVNLYLDARMRPLRKMRTILMGVERQHQGRMLHHALILSTYLQLLKHPTVEVCDLSLISEPLTHLLRQLRRYNAERYKTWRVYQRDIAADAPLRKTCTIL